MTTENNSEEKEQSAILKTFKANTSDGTLPDYQIAVKKSEKAKTSLQNARAFDVWLQICLRVLITLFFGVLLWVQNHTVFKLVTDSVKNNTLSNLQPIFSVLIASTIAETYFIAKIIVEWVVKDIKYD